MTAGPLSSRERLLEIAIPLASSLVALAVAAWYIGSLIQAQQSHAAAVSSPVHVSYVYPVVQPERARAALLDALKTVGWLGWVVTFVYLVRRFAGWLRSR